MGAPQPQYLVEDRPIGTLDFALNGLLDGRALAWCIYTIFEC